MDSKQETFNWRDGKSPIERKIRTIARTMELANAGIPLALAEEQAEWEDKENQKLEAEQISKERETTGGRNAEHTLKQILDGVEEMKTAVKGERPFLLSPREAAKAYGEAVAYERARRDGKSHEEARDLADGKSLNLETMRRWRKGLSPTFTDEHGETRHVWPDDGMATEEEWKKLIAGYVSVRLGIPNDVSYNDNIMYKDTRE